MVRSSGRRRAGRFYARLAIGGMVAVLLATAAGPAAMAADGPSITAIITYAQKPSAADKQEIKALGGTVRRAYGLINALVVTMPSNALERARHAKNVKTLERDATITTLEPLAAEASTSTFEYDNAWGVKHIGSKAGPRRRHRRRRRQGRGHRHRARLRP